MRTSFEKVGLQITGLKDAKGKPVIEGLKKIGQVGLLIRTHSVTALFDRLVATEKLQYLLKTTWKHFSVAQEKKAAITTTLEPTNPQLPTSVFLLGQKLHHQRLETALAIL